MSLSLSLAPPTWRVGSLRRGNIRTKVRKITFASHYLSHSFFPSVSLFLPFSISLSLSISYSMYPLSISFFPSLYLSTYLFLSFSLSLSLSFFLHSTSHVPCKPNRLFPFNKQTADLSHLPLLTLPWTLLLTLCNTNFLNLLCHCAIFTATVSQTLYLSCPISIIHVQP